MILQISIIFLNTCMAFVGLAIKGRSSRYFLNPVNSFWLIFLYFSVLQPLTNISAYNARYGAAEINAVLLCFFLCGISVYFGNRLSIGKSCALILPKIQCASKWRIELIAQLLLVVGLLLTVILISAYGGVVSYFGREKLRLLEVDVSGYFTLGPKLMTFGVLIGLSTAVYYDDRYSKIIYSMASLMLLVWFVVHGSRSSCILVVAILFGSFFAPHMRRPSSFTLLATLFVITLLVGFLGAFRGSFHEFASIMNKYTLYDVFSNSIGFIFRSENTGTAAVSINEDFGMASAVLANVPNNVNYNKGYMFLQLFTQAVPRAFWPGKVYPDGEAWHVFHAVAGTSLYINSAGYFSGPAPTIVGKYYYSFGVLGVIFGSMLSGVMLRTLWEYLFLLPHNVRAIFMISFAPIGYMEANNPTLWLTFWLPTAGVTLALLLVFSGYKNRFEGRVSE